MANTTPTNLYEYYQGQGQSLPSIQERSGIATQAGIQNYTGSAQQNASLLAYLQTPKPPTSGSPTPPALPNSVNSSNLAPGNTPVIPTVPNTPSTYTPPNMATAPVQDLTASEQAAIKQSETLPGSISKLYEGLTGQSKELTNQENLAGVGTLKATLQGLNNDINIKSAELQQYDAQQQQFQNNIENQTTDLGIVVGQQAEQARQSAITRSSKVAEIGLLNARALSAQGNITLAQDTAAKAVEAKYAPIKEQIVIQEAQLKAIEPLLTSAERKQAANQALKLADYTAQINKQAKMETEVSDLAFTLQQNGAPQKIVDAALKAKSKAEIQGIVGVSPYLTSKADQLDLQLKKLQIQKAQADLAGNGTDMKKLLSVEESIKLGVPYGTTVGQAAAMGKNTAGGDALAVARGVDKIDQLQNLISNDTGITSSAGLFRGTALIDKSKVNDWRADVKNVLSRLTVDELGRVKTDGVTFGALSDSERKAVGDAASSLNAAMIPNKDGTLTGRFKISEDKLKKELETIQKYAKIDFEKRTGQTYEDYKQNGVKTKVDNFWSSVDGALKSTNNAYTQAGYK